MHHVNPVNIVNYFIFFWSNFQNFLRFQNSFHFLLTFISCNRRIVFIYRRTYWRSLLANYVSLFQEIFFFKLQIIFSRVNCSVPFYSSSRRIFFFFWVAFINIIKIDRLNLWKIWGSTYILARRVVRFLSES